MTNVTKIKITNMTKQKKQITNVTKYQQTKYKYDITQEDKKTNLTKYNQVQKGKYKYDMTHEDTIQI